VQGGVQENVALGQSLQNLPPQKGSREYNFIGYMQFTGEPFQPSPLWPIANDPVLGGWVSLLETCEGPQAQVESLQVQETSNADRTERPVVTKRKATQSKDFIFGQGNL
jgi:hypothetical protein